MAGENLNGKRELSQLDEKVECPEAEERCQRLNELHQREGSCTDEERINGSKVRLRDHIGYATDVDDPESRRLIFFFIEIGPRSPRGGAAYFYHVRCFEQLADFAHAAFLDRVIAVTRRTARMRGLGVLQIIDGNYFVDAGAERLIEEWKLSMEKLMDERDGVPIIPLDPDYDNLLHKSGSASYKPKRINGMSDHQFRSLSHDMAPIESSGVDDTEEWNLFEQYLPLSFDKPEDLFEPHSLSIMLHRWRKDKVLACADDERLSNQGKEAKKELGDIAIEAIRRLSAVYVN